VTLERHSAHRSPDGFAAEFCALPSRICREPYRSGLMAAPTCLRLFRAGIPPVREFWLCAAGPAVVGRIAANVSAARPDIGYFGLFEAELGGDFAGAARLLLRAAREWLHGQGARTMVGPVAFNTWLPYRLRLDDGDGRRFDWEPGNPPAYVRAVEEGGFELVERYTSTAFGDLREVAARLEPAYRSAVSSGYRFRRIDREEVGASIRDLHRLSHAAFADNFLFEPIPEAMFADVYLSLADKGRPILLWFVVDPGGAPVGFLYAFIDHWRSGGVTETLLVLKSVGIAPAARGRGLSNALVHLAICEALHLGVDYAVSALVRAGIQSESYARKGRLLWRHDYGLWQQRLG
jgi:GNAT superfamily N-acetyltransferase